MRKRIIVLIVLVVFLVGGFLVINNNDNQKKVNNNQIIANIPKNMAGSYKLVSAKDKDKTFTDEEINKIKDDYRIIIKESNLSQLHLNKHKLYMRCDEDSFTIVDNKNKPLEKINYIYQNDKITMYYNDNIYVFAKVTISKK